MSSLENVTVEEHSIDTTPIHKSYIFTSKIGDKLTINVEVKEVALLDNYSKLEDLVKKVRQKLKVVLQIDAVVKLVEPQSLKRFEGKAKRVTDLRKI